LLAGASAELLAQPPHEAQVPPMPDAQPLHEAQAPPMPDAQPPSPSNTQLSPLPGGPQPPSPAAPGPPRSAQAVREFLGLGPAPDAAAAKRGAPVYAANCSFCHGPQARGAEGPSLI